jgi:hypothetical protein
MSELLHFKDCLDWPSFVRRFSERRRPGLESLESRAIKEVEDGRQHEADHSAMIGIHLVVFGLEGIRL